jgi:radical SAM protein with 4Fe4S-binding SPASM domain
MTFEGFPIILGWELTLACNLKCEHCGSAAGTPKESELTTDEAIELCKQFPELLVQEVDFTGGEPLTRKDWTKIAARLTRLGIPVNMITNGLALDRQIASLIKKANIAHIGISLDGLENTHDRIRGHKGLFKKIIAAISLLNEKEIPFAVMTTVTELNARELPEIQNLLLSIGVSKWRLQPLFPLGRVISFPELVLKEQTYLDFGVFIKTSTSRKDSTIEVVPADSCGYFGELDDRNPSWHGCNAGLVTCGITCDGKIKGCLSLPDSFIEGDLRKKDLWSIWFSQNAFKYTRAFMEKDLGQNCASCEMAFQCQGGCSAMSFGSTGKLHNDPYCYLRLQKNKRLEKKNG